MNKQWIIRKGEFLCKLNVRIETLNQKLYIYTPYDAQLLEELRAFEGSRWEPDPPGPCWIIPDTERNQYAMYFLETGQLLKPKFFRDSYSRELNTEDMMHHQVKGARFLIESPRRMLAYDMGLGKTLTTIRALEVLYPNPWWLIAPFGAQKAWERELIKWNALCWPKVVSTYESLEKVMRRAKKPPECVVFDESVKIKNPLADRSQIAAELCRLVREQGGFIIELSGSPAPKDPGDWWHQVECLQPGFIREGNIHKFRKRYANVEMVDHGYGPHPEVISWKEDELVKLGKRLSPLVLVKTKKECYDLPEKIYETIHCETDEETTRLALAIIESADTGIIALEKLRELSDGFQYDRDVQETDGSEPDAEGILPSELKRVTRYLANPPKLSAVESLLDQYHTDNEGCGRLVIFAVYHASIDLIGKFASEKGWRICTIDGRGWSDPNTLTLFEDSKEENVLIVAHPGSVYGLTFSKTLCLCYYSNSFDADHRIQSEDRRDRPGMDKNYGTRIVDLVAFPVDDYVKEKVIKKISIQGITLGEIKRLWNLPT